MSKQYEIITTNKSKKAAHVHMKSPHNKDVYLNHKILYKNVMNC